MGFIGGGEEVKKAILNGLQSNVNQLVKLLQASCGGEGCCKDVKNFRDGHLKKLQKTFNDIDEIEREINGLKKQKDIAEKRKAPEKAPSVGESEIDEQIKKKTVELEKEISQLQPQLDKLKEEIPTKIQELNNNVSGVSQKLTDTMREIQSKIEAHKNEQKGSQNNVKNISIPYDLSNSLATAQAKLKSHEASLGSLESLEKLITFHQSVEKNKDAYDNNCKNLLNNLCSGLEKFLGYQETSKGYSGEGIVYSDLDRLCDGVMSFLHGVLESVKEDESVTTYSLITDTDLNNVLAYMHNGKYGFIHCIDAVIRILRDYDVELHRRTDAIKTPLSALSIKIESHKIKVDEEKSHEISDQITSWTQRASQYIDTARQAESALQKIDPVLSSKLKCNVSSVLQGVKKFKEEAGNEDLRRIYDLTGTNMFELLRYADERFNASIDHLRKYLEKKITTLCNKLESLRDEQFYNLKTFVDNDLQRAFKAVDIGISEIQKRQSLESAFSAFKSDLKTQLENVNNAINTPGSDLDITEFQIGGEKPLSDVSKLSVTLLSYTSKLSSSIQKFNGHTLNISKTEVSDILTSLGKISQTVAEHSKEVLEKTMAAIKTQLEKEIKAVAGIINEKLTKISTALKHDKEVDADYGVGVGQSAKGLANLFKIFGEKIDTVLEQLKKTVGHDGEKASDCSIFADLFQLKNNITELGQNVNGVQKRVGLVGEELERCVKESIDMLVKAPRWAATIVDSLRKEVNAKIEQMFRHVQDEAKKLYTNRKKIELSALHEIVTDQLKQITEIIKNDLNTGLKGFLNVLRDKHNGGQKLHDLKDKQNVESLSPKLKDYVYDIFQYVFIDLPKHLPYSQYSPQLSAIHSAVATLLSHLSAAKHFTHRVPGMLQNLKTSVQALHSTAFANPAYPVLDAFPKSLERFVEQLEKGYVNRYEGSKPITWQEHFSNNPTEESKMTAKIFLSVFSILNTNLSELRKRCKVDWRGDQINEFTELGTFFSDNGFVVSDNNKQNGELQNKEGMNGTKVVGCLVGDYPRVFPSVENTRHAINTIVDSLPAYYQVGHISTFSANKLPCSVYEMLAWCSGLRHNGAYDALKQHIKTAVKTKDAQSGNELPYTDAFPRAFGAQHLENVIEHITLQSASVLTSIVGHGNASTTYSCDYFNNSFTFKYPSSGSECLDLLIDILKKLFPPLRFLHTQCNRRPDHYGWADCLYGQAVEISNWQCNDHLTDKASDQPTDQPRCQANCQANCRPTSPLQSYLTDSLHGYLPHQLQSVGCTPKCLTCPGSKRGMHCLTPLGFRGFSGSPKHGNELCKVLRNFFDDFYLTALFCLAPKPPTTLPEHLGFALSIVSGWRNGQPDENKGSLQSDVVASITDQSIQLYVDPSQLTDALTAAYGSSSATHSECQNPHLRGLTTTDCCKGKPER
ncbi:hypothetical protein, conserved [Babesia ovata]|uniref:Extracellular matrix-binding ebh n=1 Tax=Babesia ovata TaxID=189622 RepID=A0A2H6KJZ2_9APIC|nr:uncharacterized protein BOVATA_047920 [Babesia ovata]GBE63299.1 hypothetical protein, conserved [Babesia ovata]